MRSLFALAGARGHTQMTTTIVKVERDDAGREMALVRELRDAGVSVLEVKDWEAARESLARCEKAVIVCDDGAAGAQFERVVAAIGKAAKPPEAMPPEGLRALSHELRTPLSAMAGWVHLLETGKLDAAGIERAIAKLKANIDEQVRTIDRHLGTKSQEGRH